MRGHNTRGASQNIIRVRVVNIVSAIDPVQPVVACGSIVHQTRHSQTKNTPQALLEVEQVVGDWNHKGITPCR